MTEIEAVEKLRAYCKCKRLQLKSTYEDCNYGLCDKCELCYAQGTVGEHIKSIDIAIHALEKQIPKKPYKDNENGVYEKDHCPTCHRSLFPNDHHCECGQKIDWSDEK